MHWPISAMNHSMVIMHGCTNYKLQTKEQSSIGNHTSPLKLEMVSFQGDLESPSHMDQSMVPQMALHFQQPIPNDHPLV